MSTELIYLASPYSHTQYDVRLDRFHAACRCAGALMKQSKFVFSPIAHCHQIAIQCGLPKEFYFWEQYDELMISKSDHFYILKIDGWDKSAGVQRETELAFKWQMDKPVFVNMNGEVVE